jgi:hypothetical protein
MLQNKPMTHGNGIGSVTLSILSGISALLSLANVQPILTFLGSAIAIVSGLLSIYKKLKSK